MAVWTGNDTSVAEAWASWERARLQTMTARRNEQMARFDIDCELVAYLRAASELDDAEKAERRVRRLYVRARGGI